jgi:serine/threonine-protein kinase RsbW/stage II sporulation protein AB (anti-sigma F factor)
MTRLTQSLDEVYEAEPESVARARSRTAAYAASAGAVQAQVDSVRLAVSEAVTNAVVHGYGGSPGRVWVTAGVSGRELWIVVRDAGTGLRPVADRPGLGLGLGLIAQISDHMTIVPHTEGGTELRMRFDLAPDAWRAPGGDWTSMMLRPPRSLASGRQAAA